MLSQYRMIKWKGNWTIKWKLGIIDLNGGWGGGSYLGIFYGWAGVYRD